MAFLFAAPDLSPLVAAAYVLAGGGVIGAVVWGASIVLCARIKYRK